MKGVMGVGGVGVKRTEKEETDGLTGEEAELKIFLPQKTSHLHSNSLAGSGGGEIDGEKDGRDGQVKNLNSKSFPQKHITYYIPTVQQRAAVGGAGGGRGRLRWRQRQTDRPRFDYSVSGEKC